MEIDYKSTTTAFTELIGKNFIPDFTILEQATQSDTIAIAVCRNTSNNSWHIPYSSKLINPKLADYLTNFLINIKLSFSKYSTYTTMYEENLLVLVNLGEYSSETELTELTDSTSLRKAAAAVTYNHPQLSSLHLSFSTLGLNAVVEGAAIGAYSYKVNPDYTSRNFTIETNSKSPESNKQLEEALIIAQAVILTTFWVNTPPNLLYPEKFAQQASDLSKTLGVTSEIIDYSQLKAQGYGGIVGVGQGSERKPCLLILNYTANPKNKRIGLVGKGITFDSGGISIKPASGMEEMTSDMAGAATMIAVFLAAARLKLPLNIQAVIPLAENLPSGSAQRPGDVLTQYGGKTVQVLNTDAEGRLVLADALVKAAEKKPDVLLDAATLTGAQIVALGTKTFGIMGNNTDFNYQVHQASLKAGEPSWPMPFPAELKEGFQSEIADLTNHTNSRSGGMLAAGIFLSNFVPDDVIWSHLDIAGPAYNTSEANGLTKKGATGVPVRSVLELLKTISNQ